VNVQTEPQDNHTLRLIVEVPLERLEATKGKAAKKLAGKIKVPGFRQGKAPYNVIAKYLGEAAILEEAVELLGNEIYGEVIDAQDIEAYGPGSIEDVKLDPLTFTYLVSLQPQVEFGEYRQVRVPYEPPKVSDEDVDGVFETLRKQRATSEARENGAELGDRLKLNIHAVFVDGDELEDGAEREGQVAYRGDEFLHQHDAEVELNLEEEPILAGFTAAMVGVGAGERREFDLVIAADDEDYPDLRGRTVHFDVEVLKVEQVLLPDLDDAFAALLTADESEPLTLEQLRVRVRDNMESQQTEQYDEKYPDLVLDRIMELTQVKYPPRMVEARIDEMMQEAEGHFKESYGVTLSAYFQLTGTTAEKMREQMRSDAETWVKRSLVLSELVEREQIRLYVSEVDAVMEASIAQMNVSAKEKRRLKSNEQRSNVANYLIMQRMMRRLVAIGKGEAPPLEVDNTPVNSEDLLLTLVEQDQAASTEVEEQAARSSSDE